MTTSRSADQRLRQHHHEFEGTGASDSADGNTVTFTITRTDQAGLDGALNYPTTVGWRLSGSAINWGSAANERNQDLRRRQPRLRIRRDTTYGNVVFNAGETTKQVTVTFYGDNYVESETPITFNVVSASAGDWLYDVYGAGTDGYGPANVDNTAASVTERAQRRHPPLCRRLGHQRWGHQRLLHQRADQRL
jgi:hypothetical protein